MLVDGYVTLNCYCVNVFAWCPVMDWCVFQDGLKIHCDPDQDKMEAEDD